jgi:hypothetical protein
MAQRIEKLRDTLAELEVELSEVDSLDEGSRQRLREVAEEIAEVLRRSDARSGNLEVEPPHTVREQLLENVETFRVQHPTLAGILQRLVDGLAQLGI